MLKKINKDILRLAIPNILSNISVPLLSTVDTVLMGSLSSLHLAAVGIASMIFNIIYWNFGFLRMGTTGMTAQFFGAKKIDEIWISFMRASLLAVALALLLLIFQNGLYNITQSLMSVSEGLNPMVYEYFKIRIWAAPASLLLMVVMGWFFGVQNALYPLALTLIINVSNIAISYYLVKIQGMGVTGVALGTVLAQYIGLIIGLIIIAVYFSKYIQFQLISELKQWNKYGSFLKVNFDLFLRTACLTFAFGFFYRQSSRMGDVLLAVNVVLMQFINWMSYGIDGFAYATESLVGRFKGAKDELSAGLVIKQSFIWAGLVSLIYALIYWFFGEELFYLFTRDPSLFQLGQELMPFIAVFPLFAFASYIWDGIFVGLTATTSMRNSMLFALIVYLLIYYILPVSPNGSHIWIALSAFVISRAIFQYLYYNRFGLQLT